MKIIIFKPKLACQLQSLSGSKGLWSANGLPQGIGADFRYQCTNTKFFGIS